MCLKAGIASINISIIIKCSLIPKLKGVLLKILIMKYIAKYKAEILRIKEKIE